MRFPYRGAGIACIDEKGIILAKRAKKPFIGTWAVPGGGFEKLKDFDDFECAVREFNEETGLQINIARESLSGQWTLKFPFFSWTTFFVNKIPDLSKVKLDELSEIKYVTFEQSDKLHLRPFSQSEIKSALRIIKKQQAI